MEERRLSKLEGMSSRRLLNKIVDESMVNYNYLALFSNQYSYRLKTISLFEPSYPEITFDFYFVGEDLKLKEYKLFDNLWRETLLLSHLYQKEVKVCSTVLDFGQLPRDIIYRQVHELTGKSFLSYVQAR